MQGLNDNLGLTTRGQRIDNTVDVVYGRSPLVDGDLLTWSTSTWTTEPPLFFVPGRAANTFLVSDNNNELKFQALNKTAEFTGDGITTALDLSNTGVGAGAYTLPLITVSAKGRITLAASGVEDISIGGDGSGPSPLRVLGNYTLFTQTQSIPGNSTNTIAANTRLANSAFNNPTFGGSGAALDTVGGTWTCKKTGLYAFSITANGTQTDQDSKSVRILVTNAAGLVAYPIARQDIGADGGSNTVASLHCSAVYPMQVTTDSIIWQVDLRAGGSETMDFVCSAVYLGALA